VRPRQRSRNVRWWPVTAGLLGHRASILGAVSRPLDDAEDKLWRAHEHLKSLSDEWTRFLRTEGSPVRVRKRLNVKRREYRVWVDDLAPLPSRFGVILGDYVHNLRATLNYLAWELARHDLGGVTPSDATAFPVVGTREEYRDATRCAMLADIAPRNRDRIEQFQVHMRGGGEHNPLQIIGGLNNRDKHRTLNALAAAPSAWGVSLVPNQDCEILEVQWSTDRPLVLKGDLLVAELNISGLNPKVKMLGDFIPDITFGEGGRYSTTDLLGTGGFVRVVFVTLAPLIDPGRNLRRGLPGFSTWPPLERRPQTSAGPAESR
jgi:hypothetical protein